jgi:hypothetical protein
MISEVLQKDTATCNKATVNVLFNSACDQNAQGNVRVYVEEFERGGDKFLNTFLIAAFVETVNDDEMWTGKKVFGIRDTGSDSVERLVH